MSPRHTTATSEPAGARPFSAWASTWLSGFTKPTPSVFREVLRPPWANAKFALPIVAIGGLLTSAAAEVSFLARPNGPEPVWMIGDSPPARILFTALTFLVLFVVVIAVIQFIAYLLGGRGTVSGLAFLIAVYAVPINVLGSLISTTFGSSPASLPATCILPYYSFALAYVAVRAVHRLSPGPTLLALLPALGAAACAIVSIWLASFPAASKLTCERVNPGAPVNCTIEKTSLFLVPLSTLTLSDLRSATVSEYVDQDGDLSHRVELHTPQGVVPLTSAYIPGLGTYQTGLAGRLNDFVLGGATGTLVLTDHHLSAMSSPTSPRP